MIIDGHAHACGKFLTPESILENLDKNGVDKVVLVPGELNSKTEYPLPNLAALFPKWNVVKLTNYMTKFVMTITKKVKQIEAGNEYVYRLTQSTNGRVIQFIWVTTFIHNPVAYLNEKYSLWKFAGVKLHQCWESFSIDSDFFIQVASWAEKNDLPLFIHLYSNSQVIKLIEYKKQHPNLKLIVAHLFGVEIFIKNKFKDNNLYFDTSTIQLVSSQRLMDTIAFLASTKFSSERIFPMAQKIILLKTFEGSTIWIFR